MRGGVLEVEAKLLSFENMNTKTWFQNKRTKVTSKHESLTCDIVFMFQQTL